MNKKRSSDAISDESDAKVSAKVAKVSETENMPFDLYQFVGEEQPFTFVRVDTDYEAAVNMRKKITSMMEVGKEVPMAEQTQFHVCLQSYLLDDIDETDADEEKTEDDDAMKEVKKLVGDRSKWRVLAKKDWAPIVVSGPIANLFVLNTWG